MSALQRRVRGGAMAVAMLAACMCMPAFAHTEPANANTHPGIDIDTLAIPAPALGAAPLRVRVLRAHGDCIDLPCPVLYVNDGQDLEAVGLAETLAQLRAEGSIRPLLIVAIDMPADRLGAYGLVDRSTSRSVLVASSARPIGTHAHAYARWFIDTLVPRIDGAYRTQATPAARTVLGWSLGAAQAFDMAWQ